MRDKKCIQTVSEKLKQKRLLTDLGRGWENNNIMDLKRNRAWIGLNYLRKGSNEMVISL